MALPKLFDVVGSRSSARRGSATTDCVVCETSGRHAPLPSLLSVRAGIGNLCQTLPKNLICCRFRQLNLNLRSFFHYPIITLNNHSIHTTSPEGLHLSNYNLGGIPSTFYPITSVSTCEQNATYPFPRGRDNIKPNHRQSETRVLPTGPGQNLI